MSDPQILKRQLILQHIMSNEVYAQYLDALSVLLVDNMAPAIYLMFLEEDQEKTNKKWRVLFAVSLPQTACEKGVGQFERCATRCRYGCLQKR